MDSWFVGLLSCLLLGSVVTSAGEAWQLTMSYEEGALALLDARSFPLSAKTRTPNVMGAYVRVPAVITWLDAAGVALAKTDAVLPLGYRVPPALGDGLLGGVDASEVFVVRVVAPELEVEPVAFRMGEPSVVGHAAANPAWAAYPVAEHVFTLPRRDGVHEEILGPISVTKVMDNGPDENRLVLVFLGDGYTREDLNDGTYSNDVAAVLAAYAEVAPWDEMLGACNVYRIDVASEERGADYDDGEPGVGSLRNTYFNTSFYKNGVERLLGHDSAGKERALNAANVLLGPGVWDQLLLIVNSKKYGGAGGLIAVNSMHGAAAQISIHEVGHSYAGLADEYEYGGDEVYSGGRPTNANADTEVAEPKWSGWILPGTPLPTPEEDEFDGVVGAFEGAKATVLGVYRPMRRCKMRGLNSEFCPVCREHHLKLCFDLLEMVESVSHPSGTTLDAAERASIAVATLPMPTVAVEWYRDGALVTNIAAGGVFEVNPSTITAATQELVAKARYVGDAMLAPPEEVFRWTVHNRGSTAAGTPFWWLAARGVPTTNGGDWMDHDQDGFATAVEYLADTDPLDPASRPMMRLGLEEDGSLALRWGSSSNRTYRLYQADDLATWTPVPGHASFPGTGDEMRLEIPLDDSPSRFFKLHPVVP